MDDGWTISPVPLRPRRVGTAPVEVPRVERTRITADLFTRLSSTDDEVEQERLREQIVLANASVARSLSRRYRHRGLDQDDLEQTAYLTLVLTVQRFDPSRGVDFLSFAVPTIVGELKRLFRDHGWTVRVPRRVQEVQLLIDRQDLPRFDDRRYGAATVADLVDRLDVPAREVEAALMARDCFNARPLTDASGADGRPLHDALVVGLETLEAVETRALLAPIWRRLSPRDRKILRLRYLHDLTQSAVAEQVGLTQAQVSRILTRLLADLRSQLLDGVDSSRRAG